MHVTRTSLLCRFRIWGQNSNIVSVASDIAHIMWIYNVDDWFSHNRCSNCYNYYPCCQEVVLYAQSMDQNSLYQISKVLPVMETHQWHMQILTIYHLFEGIPSPIPSHSECNTSDLMGIVSLKRACHKILSIGKCTYRTLPETAQCAYFSLILAIWPW